MASTGNLLAIGLISSFFIAFAGAQNATVECYVCNSHPDEDGALCLDPVDESKLKKETCDYGNCFKYHQSVEDNDEIISRGCTKGPEKSVVEDEKKEGCSLSTGTKRIKLQICTCNSKLCNGAGFTRAAFSVISASVVLSAVAMLL